MVTINDVAAHAGVGAGTVSRVLNDSPQVSPTTRARVLAAIEVLGYRPNPFARGLAGGRCQTIGVVVPFFTHASAIERLRGVVTALDSSRYDIVLFDVESPLHLEEHFRSLRSRGRADGVLVLTLAPADEDLARLRLAGVPIVLIDARGAGLPAVVTDDVEGGRLATRHLLQQGHRRIGFVGGDPDDAFGFTSSAKREKGYVEVLEGAGIPADPALRRRGPHDREAARALVGDLLASPERPTAIFASSDTQAVGVCAAAAAAGLAVPENLSVVGFDDIELASYAGLTTVRQPLFESGRLGARLLLDALGGAAPSAPLEHCLPLELVVRSTTAAPRPSHAR